MDRNIVYPGAIPLSADILTIQRSIMVGMGNLAAATVGAGTWFDGLVCTQAASPNLTVLVGQGSAFAVSTVDATTFGSLAADTTDALVKFGVNLGPTTLTVTAPITGGQSVNYLVQAAFQESDGTAVILQYYNSALPSVPFSGPGNSGDPQNTQRLQRVNVTIKAGTPAATGSQTTPAPDSGFTGLYAVTVANGATTVVNANIAMLSTAPFIDPTRVGRGMQPGRLIGVQTFTTPGTSVYTATIGTRSVIVDVAGGGAPGGGAPATGASSASLGAPGSGGSFGRGKYTSSFNGVTVTVGAPGVAASGVAGTNGGPSSFGGLLTAPGGIAGSVATGTPLLLAGPAPVAGTGANIGGNSAGQAGQFSINSGFTSGFGLGGSGGNSPFGTGGSTVGSSVTGNAATGFSAGGSGTSNDQGSGALVGGSPTGGIVTVYEYS